MPALIASSVVRTCFGDGRRTFDALLTGRCGLTPLPRPGPIRYGYQVADDDQSFRAGRWLSLCVAEALHEAGVDPADTRVAALVGTGLRELRSVERWAGPPTEFPLARLHFRPAVRTAAAEIAEVLTVSNACSAAGHALALAQDMLDLGDADAVVVGGADEMSDSMLAMIGRVADEAADAVRPFDTHRRGVLLGEGAAAVVLVPEGGTATPLARLLATGLSCDAHHETAPSATGICAAVLDAYSRAHRDPVSVDLVVAHGTGTALNDPVECQVLRDTVARGGPLVTAIKGAIGHTSGASALHSLDAAIRSIRTGQIPPVVGLRAAIPEAEGLRLVIGSPARKAVRTAQVDSFGFGGVNAITLIEAA